MAERGLGVRGEPVCAVCVDAMEDEMDTKLGRLQEKALDQVLRDVPETGVDLTMHESLTPDRVLGRLREANVEGDWRRIGFCRRCGAEAEAIAPNAIGHTCDECGAAAVDGAEEIVMRVAVIKTIRVAIREGRIATPPAERGEASAAGSA